MSTIFKGQRQDLEECEPDDSSDDEICFTLRKKTGFGWVTRVHRDVVPALIEFLRKETEGGQ